jgi:predicted lipoprotein
MMAMAVRLTPTIEETIDMFCRHTAGHRGMVEIWDKKQVLSFMRENFLPYAEARLEESK